MRYFLDTEYNGWGGALLSLALVPEEGEELYLTLDWEGSLDDWVERNVVPYLDTVPDALVSPRMNRAAVVSRQRPTLAAALLGQPQLPAARFLRLANLAAALLVRFGLAGGRRVDPGGRDLHRQGDDVDRGSGHGADNAAREGERQEEWQQAFHGLQNRR